MDWELIRIYAIMIAGLLGGFIAIVLSSMVIADYNDTQTWPTYECYGPALSREKTRVGATQWWRGVMEFNCTTLGIVTAHDPPQDRIVMRSLNSVNQWFERYAGTQGTKIFLHVRNPTDAHPQGITDYLPEIVDWYVGLTFAVIVFLLGLFMVGCLLKGIYDARVRAPNNTDRALRCPPPIMLI